MRSLFQGKGGVGYLIHGYEFQLWVVGLALDLVRVAYTYVL